MCTMSWWRRDGSYGVFFNRDELKTRQRAHPPFLWEKGFLSPRDPRSSGTWLAVNQAGLILALLNRWHEGERGTLSRGQIIPELISGESVGETASSIRQLDLADHSAFTLVAIDALSVRRWDWNRLELTSETAAAPITSSSFRFEEVRERRRRAYDETVPSPVTPDPLESFHLKSGEGAYSVRMCRPDAQTWSRSRIEVTPSEISWDYHEEFLDFHRSPKLWTGRLSGDEPPTCPS